MWVCLRLSCAVGLWTKQNSFYFQSESFNNHLEGNIAYNGNHCLGQLPVAMTAS